MQLNAEGAVEAAERNVDLQVLNASQQKDTWTCKELNIWSRSTGQILQTLEQTRRVKSLSWATELTSWGGVRE